MNTVTSVPIPGAVEFAQYAAAKGVKVFYISNRTAEEEPATRKNLEKFAFPMDDKVDTFLMTRKQPDWGSAKGTRRAFVAKDYRILLNIGDNFGDFVDEYRGSEAERRKVFEREQGALGPRVDHARRTRPTAPSSPRPSVTISSCPRTNGARPSEACWRPGRAPEAERLVTQRGRLR